MPLGATAAAGPTVQRQGGDVMRSPARPSARPIPGPIAPCEPRPLALAFILLVASVTPVGTFRSLCPHSGGRPGAGARQAACGGVQRGLQGAWRGDTRVASAEKGVGFVGPASFTEQERFAQAQNMSAAAPGAMGPTGYRPSRGMEEGDAGAIAIARRVSRAWSLLNASSHTFDGFCGHARRSKRRARRDAAIVHDTDRNAPYSALSHRAGLAWGAGLELRNASSSAGGIAHTALGHDQQQVLCDPYAWRRGVSKGEVRLLSDMQLLDFEGGGTSFKLGGQRQRFDLSSLKDRWRHKPSIHRQGDGAGAGEVEGEVEGEGEGEQNESAVQDLDSTAGEPARDLLQRPGCPQGSSCEHVAPADAEPPGAASGQGNGHEEHGEERRGNVHGGQRQLGFEDARVQPLASVKRYYNQPLAPRDDRFELAGRERDREGGRGGKGERGGGDSPPNDAVASEIPKPEGEA